MAKFDGTSLLFDWYLGASSFEEAGFNLSKSYASIESDSSNNLAIKGSSNIWGNDYRIITSYQLDRGNEVSGEMNFQKGRLSVSDI